MRCRIRAGGAAPHPAFGHPLPADAGRGALAMSMPRVDAADDDLFNRVLWSMINTRHEHPESPSPRLRGEGAAKRRMRYSVASQGKRAMETSEIAEDAIP